MNYSLICEKLELLTSRLPPRGLPIFFWGSFLSLRNLDDLFLFFFFLFLSFHSFFGVLESIRGILTIFLSPFLSFFLILNRFLKRRRKTWKKSLKDSTNRNRAQPPRSSRGDDGSWEEMMALESSTIAWEFSLSLSLSLSLSRLQWVVVFVEDFRCCSGLDSCCVVVVVASLD